jgi:YD repeat-containing protein
VDELDGTAVRWKYDKKNQLVNERRADDLVWESLTVAQWSAMTVPEWSALDVAGPGAEYNVTYTYDAVGNRTVQNDSGSRTTYT